MKNKKNTGFTLVEIIISLAIIGIIAVGILAVFTGSYSMVFSMGRKTNAVSEAKTYMDKIYQAGSIPADILEVSNLTDLTNFSYNTSKIVRVLVDEIPNVKTALGVDLTLPNNKIKTITIAVFYENGKNVVTLTSLVPMN